MPKSVKEPPMCGGCFGSIGSNADRCKSCADYVHSIEAEMATAMVIEYKNYRGEVSIRNVRPRLLRWSTGDQWHPEPQWVLEVFDVDKGENRTFALRDCNFRAGDDDE